MKNRKEFNQMPQSTQLAAIMVTDIIGYSELLNSDKDKAMQLVLKNKTLQEPLIEKHNGRWLKNMQEASWAAFDNTLDAVNCAREIQATMKLQQAFQSRINIHLGEITYQNGEIIGEAISTASEIRNKSSESGVYISEVIYNTIKNNQAINLSGISTPGKTAKTQIPEAAEQKTTESAELSMDDTLLRNIHDVVHENMENEQFGVEDLANEVSLSRSHLHRKLQQLTGQSISQFIRSIRLEKSMDLLQKEVATISEIAYRVGFGSPTYFIKCFHEHYGYPPGEVKKRQNQNPDESGEIVAEYLGEQTVADEAEPLRLYEVKDTWNKRVHQRIRTSILQSDISGFSRLMAENESNARTLLEANREFHKEIFSKHGGQWVKEIGDAVIGYFMDSQNAYDCAIEIHKANKKQPYELRIGINHGNLIIEDDEVYGEGLNVVSRLMKLATPGSVILSQRLIDDIGNQNVNGNQYLGSFQFKGVNRNVGIYALSGNGFSIPDQEIISEFLKPSEIEGLQSHNSRHFIEEIFEEMARVKPELASHLKDNPDVRILAHHIIRNFPWPISVELRRLFSASLRETSLRRLLQLVKSLDRIVKLLTFILVTELYDRKLEGKLDDTGSEEFESHLKQLRSQNIIWLLRKISDCFQSRNLKYFMEEMEGVFDPKLFDDLQTWSDEKENILETGPDLNEEQLAEKCAFNENLLKQILIRLSFMINYRLVNVGSIKVHKSKNKEAQFEHSIDILNSPDSEFRTREEVLDKFSDSNAVMIMKDINDPANFLNLSPLVIDTHHEAIDPRSNLKRDIFLFDRYRDGILMYSGCEVTEKIDLQGLSNYAVLKEEYEEIIKSLTRNKS